TARERFLSATRDGPLPVCCDRVATLATAAAEITTAPHAAKSTTRLAITLAPRHRRLTHSRITWRFWPRLVHKTRWTRCSFVTHSPLSPTGYIQRWWLSNRVAAPVARLSWTIGVPGPIDRAA